MAITAVNLGKSFGSPAVNVLHDLSFQIPDGQFVSLTGRSGSGKSTLLYLLGTLDHASSGSVLIDSKDVAKLSSEELHILRNRSVGFVFQFHYLLPELTALENVMMPALKAKEKAGIDFEPQARAMEILNEFGLADKAQRLPRQLSGGEQQRVAIARALSMRPKYLFADEPTGALDSVNGELVMSLFEKVNHDFKTTVVLVTHDPAFAERAQRQIKLVDGRIVSDETRTSAEV